MLHMNKPNGAWDRIYQLMADAAVVYQFDKECAAFNFGMATMLMIESTGCLSVAEIARMAWLRKQIKESANNA